MKESDLSVHCHIETSDPGWIVDEGKLTRLVRQCLELMQSDLVRIRGVRHAVGVSCFVVPEERIRQLNNQHRRINAPTDMLSFPLGYAAPGTGWVLGDIVICLDAVADKAGASGNCLDDQLAFSLVHSLLHLVGYDHGSELDRGAMEAREEDVFGRLTIPTDLTRRAA